MTALDAGRNLEDPGIAPPPSEMVERVAIAMRDRAKEIKVWTTRDNFLAGYQELARAAIEAMREEPTEAIMNAIIASFGSDDDRGSAERALDAWLAGCDAALPEGRKP